MCGAMRISECLAQYEKFQAFLSHGCRMPILRFFLRILSPELTNIDAFDVYISGRSTDNFMGHVGCQDLVNTVIYSTIVKGFTMSRQHEQAVQPRSCEAGETPWNFHEFYIILPRKLAW